MRNNKWKKNIGLDHQHRITPSHSTQQHIDRLDWDINMCRAQLIQTHSAGSDRGILSV